MSRDLTNLFIDETFQYLTQISGSNQDILLDGVGNQITELQVTASNSTSASYASTASLLLGNAEQVGHIDFSSSAETTIERRVNWNDAAGTLNIGLKGGNVTLQVGQEEVARVVNGTGANLLESQYRVVKVVGAQGQRLQVGLAQADSDVNSATTLGIVTENIDVNQEGFITLNGIVRGINTTGALQGETWNDGDILYLSGTTPGVITNVKPLTPTHLVVVGYVVYAHANQGKIFVKVDNGYELEELHDVLITNPVNGEALVYENGIWINSDIPHVSASYAVSSSQAENANTATSASYALTASYALNAGGGAGFPYTGSAEILGDLIVQEVSGSANSPIEVRSGYVPGDKIQLGFFKGASPSQAEVGFTADNSRFQSTGNLYFSNDLAGATNKLLSFQSSGPTEFLSTGDVSITAPKTFIYGDLSQQIAVTGSSNFQVNAPNVGGLLMSVGGYVGGLGEWETTANMVFYGADQSFFSAENDFYIKNIYNDTGSITVWSENDLTLRGDTGVEIYGGDPFTGIDPQEAVNITGKAFATSIASNINGFSITIDKDTTVRSNTRAFVETPMQVGSGKTITVEAGSTLKVINEL